MSDNKKLLNVEEAAKYLDVKPGTLRVWKSTGRYFLPCVKVGRLVKYHVTDLDAFLEQRRVEPVGIEE